MQWHSGQSRVLRRLKPFIVFLLYGNVYACGFLHPSSHLHSRVCTLSRFGGTVQSCCRITTSHSVAKISLTMQYRAALHTVDITPFLKKDEDSSIRLAAARTLWDALSTHGCFYVTGHGIDEADSIKAAKLLLLQPESIKNEVFTFLSMSKCRCPSLEPKPCKN